jgi:hypothetical protein
MMETIQRLIRAGVSIGLLLMLVLLTGCCPQNVRRIPPPGGRGTITWTVMVFLNAANDLDAFSDLNVNQMESVMANPKVRVVVQWKRIATYAPQGSWTGTRRYLIRYDTDNEAVRSQLLEDMGQGVDMGDPATLREFIRWARARYPADRYALIIWNHGSGWRTRTTRAVSFDDEYGTSIKIWDLPTAIRPTSSDPVLDVLLFDASLMQMLEVAYECRYVARYIVGSEESPPGEGYPYHRILPALMDNSDIPPAEWGKEVVRQFVSFYQQEFPSYYNITQSVVDAAKLEEVANALDALAGTLLERRTLYVNALRNARMNAQSYNYPEYKDLWHVAQLMKEYTGDAQIGMRVDALHAALRQAILYEAHANNNRVRNSHGLSIYYPNAGDYLGRYGLLALARATRWDEWLQQAP